MKLSQNLWFVRGSSKAMVYNFNNCCLYRMPFQTLDYIESLKSVENIEKLTQNIPFLNYLQEENFFAEKDEANLFDKYSESKVPSFAWIEITQKCNLNCVHCYEGNKQHTSMSFSDFCLIIERLQHANIKQIQITGGEPTLHPDLIKMLDYCYGKFDFIELYTNATLISDELLKCCVRNNIRIAFSEVGKSKEEYENVTRVPGSYHPYIKGVTAISSSNIPYRIGTVQATKGDSKTPIDTFDLERADLPRLTGNATLSLYTDDMLRRKLITQKSFLKKFKPDDVILWKTQNKCFSSNIYIDVHLDVYPCPMERRLKHGNIHESPLNNILKSDILNLSKDKIDECQVCEYRYACFDCRPDSNGAALFSKPWYCTYHPQTGIWDDIEAFIYNLRKENSACLKSKK